MLNPQPAVEALRQRLASVGLGGAPGVIAGIGGPRCDVVVGRVGDRLPLFGGELAAGRSEATELLRGLAACGASRGASRLVLAVREDWWDQLAPLRQATASTRVELVAYPPRYPGDADELLLDLACAARSTPTGESHPSRLRSPLPHPRRCAVFGAAALRDAAAALAQSPLPRRLVSVVGALRRPSLLEVPLGTRVLDLARASGADDYGWTALHNGSLDEPIGPGDSVDLDTRGVLLLPARHGLLVARTTPVEDLARRCASACVNCRVCTDSCPAHLGGGTSLEPHRIVQLAARGWLDRAQAPHEGAALGALECKPGCGLCDLACPARLQPGRLVAEIAARLAEQGVSLDADPDTPIRPHPERMARRLSLARATEQRGLGSFAAAPAGSRPLVPSRLVIALEPRQGGWRQPLVAAGASVARGAPIAADSLGLVLTAPVDAQVTTISDEAMVLQVA